MNFDFILEFFGIVGLIVVFLVYLNYRCQSVLDHLFFLMLIFLFSMLIPVG